MTKIRWGSKEDWDYTLDGEVHPYRLKEAEYVAATAQRVVRVLFVSAAVAFGIVLVAGALALARAVL